MKVYRKFGAALKCRKIPQVHGTIIKFGFNVLSYTFVNISRIKFVGDVSTGAF